MSEMTEKVGDEYGVASSQLPLGIFGRSEFEILRDKKHHTAVYPSSLNHMMSFARFGFSKWSLAKLDVGFAPDGTGIQLMGIGRSFVNRRFVDAFVASMRDLCNASWESMHVWASPVRPPSPIFLESDPLSISIAPYIFEAKNMESTGKYQPI